MPQAVYFLLLPNVLSLDVSGPAETLRLAGQFSLRYLSPVPQIVCSIGMTLSGLQPLPERRKTAPSRCCRASAIRSAISPGKRPSRHVAGWRRCGPICSSSASPGVHLLRRAAGGAGRAARRLSVHHPPRRYRAYPPAGAGGAGEREPYLRRRSRRLHQRGHHHRHRFGAARSIATAAPAGRATSPAIWWSISAAPGTIRSCRPGCATATTCTRRCTARRT